LDTAPLAPGRRPGAVWIYAAATLRAISNSPSGIGSDSRQVNATGRSPRWSM
jgi:hypothetical protein